MAVLIHYSPQFLLDLDRIEDYIRDQLNQPGSAADIVDSILDDIETILPDNPEAGTFYYLPNGMNSGYRVLVHEAIHCKTFYQYLSGEIFVVREAHDLQDVHRLL